jgi:PAS domain S-box-containing protein
MTNQQDPAASAPVSLDSPFHAAAAVCMVVFFSYLAASLGGTLVFRPEMIWPLWPGCAFLVAVLLLTRRRFWPMLLIAGLAGFTIYDLQEHLPVRAIGLLLLADSIEILIAALGVRYVFAGVVRLNSVKALAKYCLFAVLLAPVAVASIAASAFGTDSWRVAVLTEALALLTLTPAILSWANIVVTKAKKPRAHYLEAALMSMGLGFFSYFTFAAPANENRPALLYSLVPFLLWAALRFGIAGTSNSMVVVAFLAVWGAVHRRGPFIGDTPLNDMLALQVFLLIAGASFMVLAAVVEEHKADQLAIRESEKRFRAVADTAPALIWMAGTDKLCTYFNKPWLDFTGRSLEQEFGNGWAEGVHPDDFRRCLDTYVQAFDRHEKFRMEYRLRHHDGEYRWILDIGVPRFSEDGSFAGYIGIAVDVTDRKKTEATLHELNRDLKEQTALLQSREELLNIFVKNVPAGVAMLDHDLRYLQVSERWCTDYSVDRSQILGRSHYEVFPDIPDRWNEVHRRALQGETLRAEEDRWDRADGTIWVRWEIRPWYTAEGLVGGILILAEDITQRKQMEEMLSASSRKLIEAQEQERARIGRELHDDINQRLAMLAVELGQLQTGSSEVQSRLKELRQETAQISNDVQALSHELHSSKMDYLGVVGGMRSWCKEFAERQNMEVDFEGDVKSVLPFEVGLSMFRVLQEALHNVSKHSGVKRVDVQLREDSEEIHLIVSDLGRGFDLDEALKGKGLGVTSMRERIRLVGGTITIDATPMGGTTIHVRVPFDGERGFQRQAV